MYIVLAGGFYGASHKQEIWGFRPTDVEDAGVDFIVDIEGLPEELVRLDEVPAKYKWYCKKCKRFVPEWEMERSYGCALHDPEPQKVDVKQGRDGVMEEYTIPNIGVKSIRIWLDNGAGREKWVNIARYIKATYPASKSLSIVTPRAVGNKHEFKIQKEDIPSINLTEKVRVISNDPLEEVKKLKAELEIELRKAREVSIPAVRNHAVFKCDKCDFQTRAHKALRMHLLKAHNIVYKKKGEKDVVLNNGGNTDTASSVENEKQKK